MLQILSQRVYINSLELLYWCEAIDFAIRFLTLKKPRICDHDVAFLGMCCCHECGSNGSQHESMSHMHGTDTS